LLHGTAVALKNKWSAKRVGSVRLQLSIAKEVVHRFDCAQDSRQLADHERALIRNKMKMKCLGLSSLLRTIMCQHSRITYLAEGDTNTKFFHLQACYRSRKTHIASFKVVDDVVVVHDDAKAQAVFEHFNDILGIPLLALCRWIYSVLASRSRISRAQT
jgi:phenylalanyl-tRNA synthetase alpha subunit